MALKWLMWTFNGPVSIIIFIIAAVLGDTLAMLNFGTKIALYAVCHYFLIDQE